MSALSDFMDRELNRIFGETFAPVLHYEVRRELGLDLLSGLLSEPSRTLGVLGRLFKGESKASLIISALRRSLILDCDAGKREKLLNMIDGIPLATTAPH